MQSTFDPKAKVKQGQFSDAPDGKNPNREHTNIDFEKHASWWTGRSLEPSEFDLFLEMLIGKGCSDNDKKI